MENKKIVWEAPEFKTHKKNFLWYLGFLIFAMSIMTYAVLSGDILTIVTFGLVVVLGFAFAIRKPRKLLYTLTGTGIQAGENVYLYRNIKNFWIIYTPENKTLNFETTALLNSHITVQLGKQDPVIVKEYLKKYIPEDLHRDESVLDIILRKLKF